MPNGLRALQGRKYSTIERVARDARTTLNLDLAEPFPGVELFERIDERLPPMMTSAGPVPVDWDVKEILPYEGVTIYGTDGEDASIVMMLREETYQGLRRQQPRARFTFAHEFGHVLLHAEDLVQRGRIEHAEVAFNRGVANHSPCFDTEFQANAFAAALLMPARALRQLEIAGQLSASEVMRRFLVSLEAASNRIDTYSTRRAELINA